MLTRRKIANMTPAEAKQALDRAVWNAPMWEIFGGLLAATLALTVVLGFVADGFQPVDVVCGVVFGCISLFLGYRAVKARCLTLWARSVNHWAAS
jgi:hypothetical protein